MKESIKINRNIIDIIMLILVACILCIPLLNKTVDVYNDDGIQHIARAYGTLLTIKTNGIFQNVILSFTNNFGYSWNLFYGPLSTICLIIINLLCNNFIVAYKLFCFICLILSGFFMYKFVLNFTRSKDVALLSGILYMNFPYHLTDLYTRNALGEYVSFIFIPLVFLGLYNLLFTTENHYYLTIGAVSLIITHNISTILVAFFSLLYLSCNIKKLQETHIKNGITINILFIITISSFFWAPMIQTKFTTHYQVYEQGMMTTPESTAQHGLNLTQLFVTKNDGSYVFELGPHIMIMLAFSVMAFRQMKQELKENYGFFLISGILSLWLSTKYFPWKLLPEQLCLLQFPWRLLMMSSFFLSIVCALNMYTLIKKFDFKDVIIISIISICYVAFFSKYIPYNEEIKDISKYNLGIISGSEYETVAGTAKAEYLPVKAYENRFYIATREDEIRILKGKANITNVQKSGTQLTANIQTFEEDYTALELPYIYYPGYEIRLDGMKQDIFETSNGFIGIVVGKDDTATLEVNYSGTKSMKCSVIISLIASIVFAIYVFKKR